MSSSLENNNNNNNNNNSNTRVRAATKTRRPRKPLNECIAEYYGFYESNEDDQNSLEIHNSDGHTRIERVLGGSNMRYSDFFQRVADWVVEKRKFLATNTTSDSRQNFVALLLDEYAMTHMTQEDKGFFKGPFFDNLVAFQSDIEKEQAMTLSEIFKGAKNPLYETFPPTLCCPKRGELADDEEDKDNLTSCESTFAVVESRHETSNKKLLHVPRLSKEGGTGDIEFADDNIPSEWGKDGGPVLVIRGPSGSGSTVMSHEVGFLVSQQQPCFLFYFTCDEVVYPVKENWKSLSLKITKLWAKMKEEKNDDEDDEEEKEQKEETKYLKQDIRMSGTKISRILELQEEIKKANKERDETLRFGIKNLIQASIDEKTCKQNTRICADTSPEGERARVIVIIDEIGADARVLRAWACIREDLAKDLHAMLFPVATHTSTQSLNNNQQCDSAEATTTTTTNAPTTPDVRVHFVAAGIAANVSPKHVGSQPGSAWCKYITSEKAVFSQLLESNLVSSQELDSAGALSAEKRSRIPAVFMERLRNLASAEAKLSGRIESVFASLITNARCSGIIINCIIETFESHLHQRAAELFDADSSVVRTKLHEWTSAAIATFISLNGLNTFKLPQNVISFALGFVALRFPKLPNCRKLLTDAETFTRKRSSSSKNKYADVNTLFDALCTVSGIVVDNIRIQGKDEALADTFPKKKHAARNDCFFVTARSVFSMESGRFDCSPAFAAMFSDHFGPQSEVNWLAFEQNIANLCVAISMNSTSLAEVDAALRKEDPALYRKYYSEENLEKLKTIDPIYILKKEWLIFPGNIVGACAVQLHETTIGLAQVDEDNVPLALRFSVQQTVSSRPITMEHSISKYRQIVHGDKGRKHTVVMTSPPKAPFANLIVIGPNRLVLLQCKRYDSTRYIDFVDEFGKMGALKDSALDVLKNEKKTDDGEEKKKTWDESRNFICCLKQMCVESDQVGTDSVKVYAGVVLETDTDAVLKGCRAPYAEFFKNKIIPHHSEQNYTLELFSFKIDDSTTQSSSESKQMLQTKP